jgi:hypothetical protein
VHGSRTGRLSGSAETSYAISTRAARQRVSSGHTLGRYRYGRSCLALSAGPIVTEALAAHRIAARARVLRAALMIVPLVVVLDDRR